MLSKKFSLFLLTIGLLALVACAGQAGDVVEEESEDTTVAASGESAAEESEEPVDESACNLDAPDSSTTITLIGWPFAATEFYADEVKKCDEVDNIDVEIQLQDFTGVYEAMDLALSTGNDSPYDIVHATNVEIASWAPAGWLMPLDDLIEQYRDEYDLDDIPEGAWEGSVVDGKTYGVPFVGDSQVIAYRTDLFEQYDLAPPTTYDEIIAACETLQAEESIDIPFAIDLSAGWAIEIEFLAALRSFGGDYLNDDNTPAFNSPEGEAALQKLIEVKDACMGDAYLAYGYESAEAGMNSGTLAFTSIWATSMSSMWDPEQSEYAEMIEFAPAAAPSPGGALGGTAWFNYYLIPATTVNDPDLVFRMIMEATDLQSQKDAAVHGVVPRGQVTEGVPNMSAVQETIVNGVGPYENNPAIALVQAALWEELPLIIDGSKSAAEGLDAAATAYVEEATAQGFITQ